MKNRKRRNKVDIESIQSLYTIIYSLIYKAASEHELSEYEFRIAYEELVKGAVAKKRYQGSCLSVKINMEWDCDGSLDELEDEDYEGF